MRKLRILFPIFSFINSGGMRVITKLSNEWVRMGHEVEILVLNDSEPYFPLDEGVRITRKSTGNKALKLLSAVRYITRNFDRYDYFVATFYVTCIPLYLAGLIKRCFDKFIYYIQAYEPDFDMYGGSTFHKKIAELTYKMKFKRIVNSELYLDYKKLKASRVVHPGLDLKLYWPKDPDDFSPTLKIGTIGRTEAWKGTRSVCAAMELLRDEGAPFEFYVAFNDFETVPHTFVKPDGDDRLSAFYRDMDVVIAVPNSQFGAIHYPVIETMAVGSTIICTDYYPSTDSNAFRVEPDCPRAIADAVRQVLDDRALSVSRREQALQDVRQFDWPIVAEKFLSYLKEDDGSI